MHVCLPVEMDCRQEHVLNTNITTDWFTFIKII